MVKRRDGETEKRGGRAVFSPSPHLSVSPSRSARSAWGMAWAVVALITLLAATSGCRALRVDRSEVTVEAAWLTEGDGVQRRNLTASEIRPPLEAAWIYNAAAGFGTVSPLVLRQLVLVATRKGEVHAIRLDDGKKEGVDGFGESIEGTPLVQGGLLFVPVAAGRRALVAYDLTTGSTAWKVKGPPVEASLLPLDEGFVAVDVAATVRRYEPTEGAVRWQQELGEGLSVHAAPVLAHGHIIVADDQGRLVALDPADGAVEWTEALGAPVYTTMAANGPRLFVPTTRGRFFGVDADSGRRLWAFSLPDTTVRFTAPAVDNELVVFGASDGRLRALDPATGALRWTFEADDAITAPPLLTPRTVYAGTMGRHLLAVDRATGALQWEEELKGRVKSAMAAGAGYLVVLTEPHYVYLFKPTTRASDVAVR